MMSPVDYEACDIHECAYPRHGKCPQCVIESLDAGLNAEINRRVPVEQYLLDCYHGKKPLPDKDKCLELAQKLGKDG